MLPQGLMETTGSSRQSEPPEHTCFVYGSLYGDGAQLGGGHRRQAAPEGAHRSADRTNDDDILQPAGTVL